tara:strand:- start:1061 stop:1561 length:501 start_codon:yes stop_codon:yes gene_type:complete
MAASTVVKVRRDGTLKLQDGSGSPVTLEIDFEDGNFTANNLAEDADRIVIRDRGTIVGLRKGDDQVGSLSFSVHMREFTNAGAATLLDFCNGSASGSTLTSTGGSGFEQFLCSVHMQVEGTNHGDNADGQATFSKVLLTADFSEGDPNVLNVQGEVYGGVTFSGQT